jgi:hypothetical protein
LAERLLLNLADQRYPITTSRAWKLDEQASQTGEYEMAGSAPTGAFYDVVSQLRRDDQSFAVTDKNSALWGNFQMPANWTEAQCRRYCQDLGWPSLEDLGIDLSMFRNPQQGEAS